VYAIAQQLAALKLYSHSLHHTASGIGFFADHAALKEFYEQYDEAWDAVVERMMGLGIAVDHYKLADEANKIFQNTVAEADKLETLLSMERELCDLIETEVKADTQSQGTINLLAGIADASEVRQYKLNRRLEETNENDASWPDNH